MNHLPAEWLTVTLRSSPGTTRLLRYRIQPSLGRKMRLFVLIELDLFRIGVTEAVVPATF
jgi:hypothetical protein